MSWACVVLTTGQRTEELREAVASLLAQRDADVDLVVAVNGHEAPALPAQARTLVLGENLGMPAGRNAGAAAAHGELVFFLDDDARLRDDDTLARLAARFAAEPDIGMVQLRAADPLGGPEPRRWVPRLRVGDHARSSDVTAVWEGAVAVRREVFERAGRWPGDFFYGHEGIDLAWRVMDLGYRVRYEGELVALHPVVPAARHPLSHYLGARNRVWLARRHLPLPLALAYAGTWFAISAVRSRSLHEAQTLLRGYRDGLREPCGKRRRLRWRTLWRMTRAGRPPVI